MPASLCRIGQRSMLNPAFATSLTLLALLGGCSSDDDDAPTPVEIAAACPALGGQTIAASTIGLPTSGASVASAILVAPTATTPEYCKLTGAIAPVSADAPAINFQINLPSSWNGRAVQYGGSGFNGTVVTGLAALRSAAPNDPLPIAKGYVTFGGDSGHTAAGGAAAPAWALNDEALSNFAYASMKKTRDVAIGMMAQLYRSGPRRLYFFGSSEGGREALTVAQRFPNDYDGVVAVVPVIPWTALQMQGNRVSTALRQPGAWMSATKVGLLNSATLAACDAADGVADGIVSKPLACAFDPTTLRCPGGADTGNTCLSDAQIAYLGVLHTPLQIGFALTNGATSYPGWEWGGEGLNAFDNFTFWQSGSTAPSPDPSGTAPTIGDAFVRYFVARNPAYAPATFAPSAYPQRLKDLSAMLDADNPDLSAFRAHGGKLLLKEAFADYAQSPYAGIDYYNRVVATMGQPTVDGFLRFYVTPGVTHMGLGGPDSIDLLGLLDNWADGGQVPADNLVQSAVDPTTFAVTRTRPMCRYPSFPLYNGSGDVNAASSFTCSAK